MTEKKRSLRDRFPDAFKDFNHPSWLTDDDAHIPEPPRHPRGVGQSWQETDCQYCDNARQQALEAAGAPAIEWVSSRMIVCPECGNKRCPKATFHERDCTGSNEPGQRGSSYKQTML